MTGTRQKGYWNSLLLNDACWMGNDIVASPMSSWTYRYRRDLDALRIWLSYNNIMPFIIPTSRFPADIRSPRSMTFKSKAGSTPFPATGLFYYGDQTVNKYSALLITSTDAKELDLFRKNFTYEINKQVESALSDSVSNLKRRLQQAHGRLLSDRAAAAAPNLSPTSNP